MYCRSKEVLGKIGVSRWKKRRKLFYLEGLRFCKNEKTKTLIKTKMMYKAQVLKKIVLGLGLSYQGPYMYIPANFF